MGRVEANIGDTKKMLLNIFVIAEFVFRNIHGIAFRALSFCHPLITYIAVWSMQEVVLKFRHWVVVSACCFVFIPIKHMMVTVFFCFRVAATRKHSLYRLQACIAYFETIVLIVFSLSDALCHKFQERTSEGSHGCLIKVTNDTLFCPFRAWFEAWRRWCYPRVCLFAFGTNKCLLVTGFSTPVMIPKQVPLAMFILICIKDDIRCFQEALSMPLRS